MGRLWPGSLDNVQSSSISLAQGVAYNLQFEEKNSRGFQSLRALTDDPQLDFPLAGQFANSWIAVELCLHVPDGIRDPIAVYRDFGKGYSEETAIRGYPNDKGQIFIAFGTGSSLKSLRVDPDIPERLPAPRNRFPRPRQKAPASRAHQPPAV